MVVAGLTLDCSNLSRPSSLGSPESGPIRYLEKEMVSCEQRTRVGEGEEEEEIEELEEEEAEELEEEVLEAEEL